MGWVRVGYAVCGYGSGTGTDPRVRVQRVYPCFYLTDGTGLLVLLYLSLVESLDPEHVDDLLLLRSYHKLQLKLKDSAEQDTDEADDTDNKNV